MAEYTRPVEACEALRMGLAARDRRVHEERPGPRAMPRTGPGVRRADLGPSWPALPLQVRLDLLLEVGPGHGADDGVDVLFRP